MHPIETAAKLSVLAFAIWCGALLISALAGLPLPTAAAGAFFILMCLRK